MTNLKQIIVPHIDTNACKKRFAHTHLRTLQQVYIYNNNNDSGLKL